MPISMPRKARVYGRAVIDVDMESTDMTSRLITVKAEWDNEAKVFVATSDDVPGLATEASDLNLLQEKLEVMIPELIELNYHLLEREDAIDSDDEVRMNVVTERTSTIRMHA